ncbi:MAG: AAA-like domain-containing protein [Stenomitos rutilans HA7619-LM2]|nr:AAA-like domain-containing protein [Stenomitos rutilans HA7619-LM2]
MTGTTIYTVGGTVQAGGGVYLPRRADEELLALCRSGTFAYVLTPRQMGKSSLMVQTAETLAEEGIRSAVVDLQDLGAQVTAEQWYFGFLVKLEDQLMLDTDVVSWWRDREHLGVSQRLTSFFEAVLLTEIPERIVIFVDEIDTTLSLDFTDDFFTAIRYLYLARAHKPVFQRLSFVLVGVATPGDLIHDPKRTPFNIGQRVDLTDFTQTEALPLADGFGLSADQATQVLGWVMQWTGGHPYLTQRLCRALVDAGQLYWTKEEVDRVVGSTFLGAMCEQDSNMQFVRDMLTRRADDVYGVLTTYREVWRGRQPVPDEEQSLNKSHLKLSGVVKRADGALTVRNPIYGEVFDDQWVKSHLPVNWMKRIQRARGIAAALAALLVSIPLTVYALSQANEATQQREIAQKNADTATRNEKEARRQAQFAQVSEQEAKKQALLAKQNEQIAKRQTALAKRQTALAERSRLQAERARQIANRLRQKAEVARIGEAEQREKAVAAQQIAEQKGREALIAKALVEKQKANTEVTAQSLNAEKLLTSNFELDALTEGVKVGRKLKELGNDAKADARTQGVATLRQIVYAMREHNRLAGHTDTVNGVSFSPDGKTLASASSDNTVKLWNLDLDDLMACGCDWLHDYLTNNPNVSESDRHLCDGVGRVKKVSAVPEREGGWGEWVAREWRKFVGG